MRKLSLALLLLFLSAYTAVAQPCVSTPCSVVGSSGQSNELGGNGMYKIPGLDVGGPGTYMMNAQSGPPYSGAGIVALQDQVLGVGCCLTDRIGGRVTFVRIAKPLLFPNTDVLVAPGAVGGVGMLDAAGWQVGRTAYENFVSLMQVALALNAGNTCDYIFWGSGEADGTSFINIAQYVSLFLNMVADFRTRVPECANALWILRGMSPTYARSHSGYRAAQAAQMLLGTHYSQSHNLLFVSTEFPDLPTNPDGIHFNADAQRRLAWRELNEIMTKNLCRTMPGWYFRK